LCNVWSCTRLPESVKEDIGVHAFSIRAQEGFAEDEVILCSSLRHDVQYKFVRPGRASAVVGVSAVPPLDRDTRRTEET
jgi:hypothetical protein